MSVNNLQTGFIYRGGFFTERDLRPDTAAQLQQFVAGKLPQARVFDVPDRIRPQKVLLFVRSPASPNKKIAEHKM